MSELGAAEVPCHHRDRGCTGFLEIVYTGPKAFLPEEYSNPPCSCENRSIDGDVALLMEMGFPDSTARDAIKRCGNVQAAVTWLTDGGTNDPATASCGSHSTLPSACSTAMDVDLEEIGECSICTEELISADAAMRCAGSGGKRHYFHAHCLTEWVRQCQQAGNGPPTCPECRGPVQIRPRRLAEFLQEKGSKLSAEDHQTLRTFHDAAEGSSDGWSNLRKDLWRAAPYIAVGAGLLAAAVAVGGVIAHSQSSNNCRRDSRQNNR